MIPFNLDESREQESSLVTIVQLIPLVLNEFPGHVTAFNTERGTKNNSSFNKKDYSARLKYSIMGTKINRLLYRGGGGGKGGGGVLGRFESFKPS